jgi:hypothetical protein
MQNQRVRHISEDDTRADANMKGDDEYFSNAKGSTTSSSSSRSEDITYAESIFADTETKDESYNNEAVPAQFTDRKGSYASSSSRSEESTYAENMYTDADTTKGNDEQYDNKNGSYASPSLRSEDSTHVESVYTKADAKNEIDNNKTVPTLFTDRKGCYSSSRSEKYMFNDGDKKDEIITNLDNSEKNSDEGKRSAFVAGTLSSCSDKDKHESDDDGSSSNASTVIEYPLCYSVCGCGPSEYLPVDKIEIPNSKLSLNMLHITSDISGSSSESSSPQESLRIGYQLKKDNGLGKSLANGSHSSNSSDTSLPPWNKNASNAKVRCTKEQMMSTGEEVTQEIPSRRSAGGWEENELGTSARAMEELGLDREAVRSFSEFPSQRGPHDSMINTEEVEPEMPPERARDLEESGLGTSSRAMEELGLDEEIMRSISESVSYSIEYDGHNSEEGVDFEKTPRHSNVARKFAQIRKQQTEFNGKSSKNTMQNNLLQGQSESSCKFLEPTERFINAAGAYLGKLLFHEEDEDLALIEELDRKDALKASSSINHSQRQFSSSMNDTTEISVDGHTMYSSMSDTTGIAADGDAMSTKEILSIRMVQEEMALHNNVEHPRTHTNTEEVNKDADEKYFNFNGGCDEGDRRVLENDSVFHDQSTISLGYKGQLSLPSQYRSQVFHVPDQCLPTNTIKADIPKDKLEECIPTNTKEIHIREEKLIDSWNTIENVNGSYISSDDDDDDDEEGGTSVPSEKTILNDLDKKVVGVTEHNNYHNEHHGKICDEATVQGHFIETNEVEGPKLHMQDHNASVRSLFNGEPLEGGMSIKDIRDVLIQQEIGTVSMSDHGYLSNDENEEDDDDEGGEGESSSNGESQQRSKQDHRIPQMATSFLSNDVPERDDNIDLRDIIIEQEGEDVSNAESSFISDDDDDEDEDDEGESSSNGESQQRSKQDPRIPQMATSFLSNDAPERDDIIDLRDIIIEQESEDMSKSESGFISDDDDDDDDEGDEGESSIDCDSQQRSKQDHRIPQMAPSFLSNDVPERDDNIDLRDIIIEQEGKDMSKSESGFISDDDDDDDDDNDEGNERDEGGEGESSSNGESQQRSKQDPRIPQMATSFLSNDAQERDDNIDLRDIIFDQEGEDMSNAESGFISDDDEDDDDDDEGDEGESSSNGESQQRSKQDHRMPQMATSFLNNDAPERDHNIDLRDIIIEQEGEDMSKSESGFISDDDDDDDDDESIVEDSENFLKESSLRTLYAGILVKSDADKIDLPKSGNEIEMRDVVTNQELNRDVSFEDSTFVRGKELHFETDLENVSSTRTLYLGDFKRKDGDTIRRDFRDMVIAQIDSDSVDLCSDSGFFSDDSSDDEEEDRMRGVIAMVESNCLPIEDNGFISDDDYDDLDDRQYVGDSNFGGPALQSRFCNEHGSFEVDQPTVGTSSENSSEEDIDGIPESILKNVTAALKNASAASLTKSKSRQAIPGGRADGDISRTLELSVDKKELKILVPKIAEDSSTRKDHSDSDGMSCSSTTYDSTATSSANLYVEDDSSTGFVPQLEISPKTNKEQIDAQMNCFTSDPSHNPNSNIKIKHRQINAKITEKRDDTVFLKEDNNTDEATNQGIKKVQIHPSQAQEPLSTIAYGQNGDATTRSVESAKLRGTAALVSAAYDLLSKAQRQRSVQHELAEIYQKVSPVDKNTTGKESHDFFVSSENNDAADKEIKLDFEPLEQNETAEEIEIEDTQSETNSSHTNKELKEKIRSELAKFHREASLTGITTHADEHLEKPGKVDESTILSKKSRNHFKARKERIAERRATVEKLRAARGGGYLSNSTKAEIIERRDDGSLQEGDSAQEGEGVERIEASPNSITSKESQNHDFHDATKISPESLSEGSQKVSSVWLSGGNARLQEKARKRTIMFQKFRKQLDRAKATNSPNYDDDEDKEFVSGKMALLI